MVYSTGLAYFLWFVSGFGALGLHRFYLNKIGSGILYIFTGGLFGLGGFYDLITLPAQVREANLRVSYRQAMEIGYEQGFRDRLKNVTPMPGKKEPIEKVILKVAKKNNGIATPSTVSLEGEMSLDEARKQLEKLVAKGFAELRVSRSGTVAYFFPELCGNPSALDFEDF
ncbi:MAG: TM2 domain-containing protein [Spirochaetales bacterium]|nr:TM2 domain-containing protein [Spirochaetales bacterium]